MGRHVGARGLTVPAVVVGTGLVLLLYGVGALTTPSSNPSADSVAASSPVPRGSEQSSNRTQTHRTQEVRSRTPERSARSERPKLLEIPRLGISAAIEDLDTTPSGELEVPSDPSQVGWWADGAKLGDVGPTVLVGHRDSHSGPAVFYGLGELSAGDEIVVRGVGGKRRTFAVTGIEQVRKGAFPTEQVYGPTDRPQLRLLTCAGGFESGEYEDNLIVYAELSRG